MKRCLRKLLLSVGTLLLLTGMTVFAEEDTILNGILIGDVDVSGMTKEEAVKALSVYEKQIGEQTITFKIGNESVKADLADFGFVCADKKSVEEALGIGRRGNIIKRYKEQKDLQHGGKTLPLRWKADQAKIKSFVEENCTKYDREAQNASLTRENGAFHFVAGEQGIELDVDGSIQAILEYLESGQAAAGSGTIELKSKITEPEGSAEQLAYVKDLLGTFSTSFSTSSAKRSMNVNSGAKHIDKTVLYPGEEFSAYNTVAPFTKENGYEMAGSYLNGAVVDSMGGGICQVTSTLYNAVLRAELEVTERSPHSMTVHYVELSGDAAIAGTYKDFKFKNSTQYPIYIEGFTTPDKKVTFNIYGKETRDSNRTISFESVETSAASGKTTLVEDPGQPLGYKAVAASNAPQTAELYKIVKVNGVETERIKVNKSSYRSNGRIVTYGTAGDPVISENLRAAIALQDEALADANIAPFLPPPAPAV